MPFSPVNYNYALKRFSQIDIWDLDVLQSSSEKESSQQAIQGKYYHILWIKEHSPVHQVDFKTIKLKPGSLLFVCKDAVQKFDSSTPYVGKILIFSEELFDDDIRKKQFLDKSFLFDALFGNPLLSFNDSGKELSALFQLLEIEQSRPEELYKPTLLRNYLFSFLLLAERDFLLNRKMTPTDSADWDYVQLMKDIIREQPLLVENADKIAKELEITLERLDKACLSIAGKLATEVLHEMKIIQIKKLLLNPSMSVKDVADQSGYQDLIAFMDYFQLHTGQSPIQFRDKNTF